MPVDSITVDNKKRVQVTKPQATTSSKNGSATVTVPMTSDKTVAPIDTVQISKPKATQTSVKAKPKTTQQPKQEKSSWVDTAVDVVGDVGAGIAGTFLGPIGGAIVGAGLKAGIGFIKAKAQGKKYTTKNLTHDLLLGAANGALGAVTLGLGGAVAKGVTKSLGKVLVTEGSKKTATFLAKEGAIGAAFGVGNEVARQTSDKITDNKDYNLGQIVLATGEGAILGPIMAKGFQLVGKALKPIGKLFGGKSVEPKVETNSSTVATETATEKTVGSETAKLGEITTGGKTVCSGIGKTVKLNNESHHISISDVIGNHFYNGEQIAKILDENVHIDSHLGSLPEHFFEKCSGNSAKEVVHFFDELSIKFNSLTNEEAIRVIKNLTPNLEKLLKQKVEMTLLGNGGNAKVIKLTIGRKSYALKILKSKSCDCANTYSGASFEPAAAFFLNKFSNKTAHFYFGKVGSQTNQGAYAISELLNGTQLVLPDSEIAKYLLSTDISNNPHLRIRILDPNKGNLPINGKFFDFGMLIVEPIDDIGKAIIYS